MRKREESESNENDDGEDKEVHPLLLPQSLDETSSRHERERVKIKSGNGQIGEEAIVKARKRG